MAMHPQQIRDLDHDFWPVGARLTIPPTCYRGRVNFQTLCQPGPGAIMGA